MKLINEDNPFENPQIKESNILTKSINQMLSKAVGVKSSTGDQSQSIAEKTTERESKNTNATLRTGGFGVTSSAAQSATLTNHFKSQSNYRRIIIGANN